MQRDTDDTTEPDPGAEPDHRPDPMLDQLRVAAAADADYRELVAAILSGFPTSRDKTTMSVRQYWSIREGLSVDNGIALFGRRIIVSQSARREVFLRDPVAESYGSNGSPSGTIIIKIKPIIPL